MSFISAIRQRSGLVVGIVALSLVLFIITSILTDPSFSFFNREPSLGSINGKDVKLKEFAQEMERLENDFQIQQNRGPNEQERIQLRDQAWNQFIFQRLYKPEIEQLGMAVTEDEIVDMVQGNNIHPAIKQAFTNPQTQQFDKAQVKQFLANINRMEPRQQAAWLSFESKLPDDRLRAKYEALLTKTEYVTRAQAAFEYRNSLTKADVQYLFVNYGSMADSTIAVTDEELNSYLKQNQFRYKVQDNRAIDFVSFSLTPSADDSAAAREELAKIATDFAAATDDTTYAAAHSDAPAKLQTLTVNDLPKDLGGLAGSLEAGKVYGPYVANGQMALYKVVSIAAEGPFSAKASHILFKLDPGAADTAKARVKATAMGVLNQIKGGADFGMMAMIHGSDGTKEQGGDLGWFDETRMVKPFANAVFGFSGTGLLPNLVETEFGYHIVKVTGAKTNVKYKVVMIQKAVTPSDKTSDAVYAKASALKQAATDVASFEAAVKAQGLTKASAPTLFKTGAGFADVNEGRPVISWAYRDETEVGKVSDIFELNDRYLVAVLTKATQEGPASLDDVRDAVTAEVRKQKKAESIIAKLGTGSIEDMQKKNLPGTVVNTTTNLLLSSSAFSDAGFDPEAVGRIFGMKQGQTSKPFKGEAGVLVVKVVTLTDAPAVDAKTDLATYKQQIEGRTMGRAQYYIGEALKAVGNVKDDRAKAF